MDAAEKRQRDLDLLQKSRQALDEGELVDRHAPAPEPVERRQAPKSGDPDVIMYRGRAVRRPGGNDVRAIIERLNSLYNDGLITKSEYDRKRNQIIDRLDRATRI